MVLGIHFWRLSARKSRKNRKNKTRIITYVDRKVLEIIGECRLTRYGHVDRMADELGTRGENKRKKCMRIPWIGTCAKPLRGEEEQF